MEKQLTLKGFEQKRIPKIIAKTFLKANNYNYKRKSWFFDIKERFLSKYGTQLLQDKYLVTKVKCFRCENGLIPKTELECMDCNGTGIYKYIFQQYRSYSLNDFLFLVTTGTPPMSTKKNLAWFDESYVIIREYNPNKKRKHLRTSIVFWIVCLYLDRKTFILYLKLSIKLKLRKYRKNNLPF